MTEQNEPIGIIMPEMQHIDAMKALFPLSQSNQILTWEKGPYWNTTHGGVLAHHQAIFGAYAALVERDVLGQVTPDDIQHSQTLLRWATGISPNPDEVISHDPVRGKSMKGIFQYRLENMQALEGAEATKQVLTSYRTLMRSLADCRWLELPDAQVMDERLGHARECTVAEKLTLLENRLRKNAQELIEG